MAVLRDRRRSSFEKEYIFKQLYGGYFMTAALGNTAQGTPFATGVDAYVYPQFIGYALRAPTTQDIYNPGVRWMDNSVSPPVIYETSGAGVWNTSTAGGGGTFTSLTVTPGPASITGTTNINTSGSGVTSIGTGGTGATNIGNATGNTAVTGSLTASTTLRATLGNITATNGNLVLSTAGNKLVIATGSNASVGTSAAMTAGAVTVATTASSGTAKVFFSRATTGGTPGNVSITAQDGTGFTLTSTSGTETSTFNWWIINA